MIPDHHRATKRRKYIFRKHMEVNERQLIKCSNWIFIPKSDFLRKVKNRIFGINFQKQKQSAMKSLSKF